MKLTLLRKATFSLIVLVFFLLLLGITAEVASRVCGWGNADGFPETYDPDLGWIPTPGRIGITDGAYGDRRCTIGPDGIRSNGQPRPEGTPILAVGDSFTFGAEVADDESWPAQLERLSGRPVINGGVNLYGVDQMVLRAEKLAARFKPDLVILAFIDEDVARCGTEAAPRGAWRPWFAVENGELVRRNEPVPRLVRDNRGDYLARRSQRRHRSNRGLQYAAAAGHLRRQLRGAQGR